MQLWSDSFKDGGYLPGDFAFCVTDPVTHVTFSGNKNPHLAWSELPLGTKSLAMICHDPDVPSRGDHVNQEGCTVPADLPRVNFFHWVLIDLPATASTIEAGEFSDGVTVRGKSGPGIATHPQSPARHGVNEYTSWFTADRDMVGDYYGYDGPCPPWNDELIHRYVFTLYALAIDRLAVSGCFTGNQVVAAMKGNILDQARITALYTLNPNLRRRLSSLMPR